MQRNNDKFAEFEIELLKRVSDGDVRLDRAMGCMLGGAAGDALGAPVEFLSRAEIEKRYGKDGILNYELTLGKARITDDTQLSMFTAAGLLKAIARMGAVVFGNDEKNCVSFLQSYRDIVRVAYFDWLITQDEIDEDRMPNTWLGGIRELWSRRCPGGTCITEIKNGAHGSVKEPCNDSKGCGGVMRVAPAGIILADLFEAKQIAEVGAEIAALTHGHPLGYIPAAALTSMIAALHLGAEIKEAVTDSVKLTLDMFSGAPHIGEFDSVMNFAVKLAAENTSDLEAIEQIGEGWVAEEALAIAVYCALRHKDDFAAGIRAAVNHSGDSDSTGAIAGNILGTHLGYSKIPHEFIDNLELLDVLSMLAADLNDITFHKAKEARALCGEEPQRWIKYIKHW